MDASLNDISGRLKKNIRKAYKYIEILGMSPCCYARNTALSRLEQTLRKVEILSHALEDIPTAATNQRQKNFTVEELSVFNGKSGNPAYVAVNGTVYDVTDNAAWAAASHFGLTAGKDLTSEFSACHIGQAVLGKLKIVGLLI